MTDNIQTSDFPQFSVLQENLLRAIRGLYKFIDKHDKVFSHIAIRTTNGNRLELFASDGQTVQKAYCGAKVDKQGSVLLDAKTLYDILPLLSPERMDVYPTEFEGEKAIGIHCGAARVRLTSKIAVSDFPFPAEHNGQFLGSVDYKMLKTLTAHLHRFQDKQTYQDYPKSIFIRFERYQVVLLATDGYAVARATLPMYQENAIEPITLRVNNVAFYTLIQSMNGDNPKDVGFSFDSTTKTLLVTSDTQDIRIEAVCADMPIPPVTTVASATLHNISDAVRFLKAYKGKVLKLEGHCLILRNGNDIEQSQVITMSESLPYMSINSGYVAPVYYTLQLLKAWGENCTIGKDSWDKKGAALYVTGTNKGYKLECWFGAFDIKPVD
jgi:hypothetical protein